MKTSLHTRTAALARGLFLLDLGVTTSMGAGSLTRVKRCGAKQISVSVESSTCTQLDDLTAAFIGGLNRDRARVDASIKRLGEVVITEEQAREYRWCRVQIWTEMFAADCANTPGFVPSHSGRWVQYTDKVTTLARSYLSAPNRVNLRTMLEEREEARVARSTACKHV